MIRLTPKPFKTQIVDKGFIFNVMMNRFHPGGYFKDDQIKALKAQFKHRNIKLITRKVEFVPFTEKEKETLGKQEIEVPNDVKWVYICTPVAKPGALIYPKVKEETGDTE